MATIGPTYVVWTDCMRRSLPFGVERFVLDSLLDTPRRRIAAARGFAADAFGRITGASEVDALVERLKRVTTRLDATRPRAQRLNELAEVLQALRTLAAAEGVSLEDLSAPVSSPAAPFRAVDRARPTPSAEEPRSRRLARVGALGERLFSQAPKEGRSVSAVTGSWRKPRAQSVALAATNELFRTSLSFAVAVVMIAAPARLSGDRRAPHGRMSRRRRASNAVGSALLRTLAPRRPETTRARVLRHVPGFGRPARSRVKLLAELVQMRPSTGAVLLLMVTSRAVYRHCVRPYLLRSVGRVDAALALPSSSGSTWPRLGA